MTPSTRSSAAESGPVFEREVARLAGEPEVRSAMQWFRDQEAELARWQMDLARIPAPPFDEAARVEWLAEKLHALGVRDVQKDEVGNVFGCRPGTEDYFLSVSAHLDTVFPANTPLNVRRQGRRLYGPGISDNAAGVTALLALAAAFENFNLRHAASLVFIGNLGEEGEGDLRGMRHIFSSPKWENSIVASVVVDGAGTDTIVAEALGSRRFEVTVRGPGGHSWSDFGAPNPIVALARAIDLFSQVRVSSSPKTTYNIGVIRGGTSVNSIPESASMRVDIRSTSASEIERLEVELRRSIEQALGSDEASPGESRSSSSQRSALVAQIVAIGNRPGGELDPNARILQIARTVDAHLGNSSRIQRASTDANIPISMGREAIAIGAGGSGGGAHTLHEWFDTAGREIGLDRILLIVLALAGAAR